jgi:hypothetical protein
MWRRFTRNAYEANEAADVRLLRSEIAAAPLIRYRRGSSEWYREER